MTTTSSSRRSAPPRSGDVARARLGVIVVHVLLIVFVIIAIGPVLLIMMNSFKLPVAIFSSPFALPTAETFDLGGYLRVFSGGNFGGYYSNSLLVTITSTALTVVCSTLAAFAIVEYKVRLAPVLAGFFLLGIMLPVRLGSVSLVQMMAGLQLVNTPVSLILVYTGISLPLGIALLVTYFREVPVELKEAAKIDGAGEWRTLQLVVPLVRPGLGAVAAITMLPIWNDLWFPLILAPGEATQTVTLGVQRFVGAYSADWQALLAALVMGALPLIILFVVFSRQFISGLSQGYGK